MPQTGSVCQLVNMEIVCLLDALQSGGWFVALEDPIAKILWPARSIQWNLDVC